MQMLPSRCHLLLLLLFAGVLITFKMDSMWSDSVDLAHHYALAFRLAEQWHLHAPDDPTLGEMNFYPNLSHTFAAILGFVVNSTFMGVQLVTLLSLALLWIGVLYIINTLPLRLACAGSIALSVLIILNNKYIGLNLHGSEIIGNFFFSQLVAQAVLFIGIAVAIFLELTKGKLQAYLFLVSLIVINTSVHLLPTLELLGLLVGLIVVNALLENDFGAGRIKKILQSAGIVLVALTGVLFNPSFTAMRKISENNGGLDLRHIAYPNGLIVLCFMSIASTFYLLYFWRKSEYGQGYTAIKYLALYGGSVASLCLLQLALIKFGFGSAYAVKKYGFGLTTYLFISLSFVCGMAAAKYLDYLFPLISERSGYFRSLVMVASFSGMFLYSVPARKSLDVSEVVSIERQLVRLRDVALPPPQSSKSNVVIGLNDMSPTINYMFSIAIAKTSREIAIRDVLVANSLLDLSRYSYILSSRYMRQYTSSNCKSYSSGSISISDAACINEKQKYTSVCKNVVDFSSKGNVVPSFITGFGVPEDRGRWIIGKKAQFSCTVEANPPKKVIISLAPFLYGEHKRQRLYISVNGKPAENFDFTGTHGFSQIELSLPPARGRDKYVVSFETPDAISPKEVGFNQDSRQLAFLVKAIAFE